VRVVFTAHAWDDLVEDDDLIVVQARFHYT